MFQTSRTENGICLALLAKIFAKKVLSCEAQAISELSACLDDVCAISDHISS